MKAKHRRLLITAKKHWWKLSIQVFLACIISLAAFFEFQHRGMTLWTGLYCVGATAWLYYAVRAYLRYRSERQVDHLRDVVNSQSAVSK